MAGAAVSEPLAAASTGPWDRLGIWASVLCAIHCLVAPLLFLAVPTVAGIWAHPGSHALIALLVLPLAGTVLCRGYRLHRRPAVALAAVLGIGCILVGSALPFLETAEAGAGEQGLRDCCPQLVDGADGDASLQWPAASVATLMGSGLLIASHVGNMLCSRACRRCAC